MFLLWKWFQRYYRLQQIRITEGAFLQLSASYLIGIDDAHLDGCVCVKPHFGDRIQRLASILLSRPDRCLCPRKLQAPFLVQYRISTIDRIVIETIKIRLLEKSVCLQNFSCGFVFISLAETVAI